MRQIKLHAFVCGLICLSAVLLISCLQPATPAPDTPATPAPAPAADSNLVKFDLASLTVIPQEIEAGADAQALVSLRNTGTTRSAYVGTLYLDGQEYGRKDITLNPGQAGSLVFPITKPNRGTYRLTMAGLEGSLRVYTAERFTLNNNSIYLPNYTNTESTPLPPLPHTSTASFTPPVTPFFISRVNFRYPFPQSFTILDKNGRQLYNSGITDITSAFVPNIEVNGDFSIQMQTNQAVADLKLQYFGYYTWSYVVAFLWPEVSTLEGFQKRFAR